MKWIVLWVIISTYISACPQPVPVPDEFGVIQPMTSTLSVACFDTETKHMEKEFATKEEAEAFIERGKKRYPDKLFYAPGTIAKDWQLICK